MPSPVDDESDAGTVPVDIASGSTPAKDSAGGERFGHLFHLIGDAVVEIEIVDLEPIVRTVNPAFEDVFGFSREEVIGESLNDFILPPTHTAGKEFDERTAAGKQNSAIVERQTATGLREFLYRGVPFVSQDGGRYGLAIYSDITEQRKYERHSRVIHRILRHNLRNDLSVVLALAGQIESDADDPAIADFAARLSEHAGRLAAVGEETGTLERLLERDHDPRPVNVDEVCRDAIDRVVDDGERVDLDVPESLLAEAIPSLDEAVASLVDNAVRYGAAEQPVRVSACETGDTVTIEVRDDGPGIPEQERAPMFDDQAITQLQHGSGVGLWLVRWTVDACGGDLEYERTVGGETVIRIVLRSAQRGS